MRLEGMKMEHETEENPLIEDSETVEADILAEMNASEADVNYYVRVNRVLGAAKTGAKEPFLFEGDASTTLEGVHVRLMEEYGSGTYRVRILKNKRLWKRFDIQVERPANKPGAASLNTDLTGMAAVTATLREMSERQNALIERLLTERQNPNAGLQVPQVIAPVDPLSMMEKFASIMASMSAAKPAGPDFNTFIEVFKSGLSLRSEIDGGGEREKGIYDLIETAMNSPLLAAIVASARDNQGQQARIAAPVNQPQPAPQPNVVPIRPAGIAPVAPPQQGGDVLAYIKQTLIYLNAQAARRSDPDLMAELLMNDLPEQLIPQLLAETGVIEQLAKIEPAIIQHTEWYKLVLAGMRKLAYNAMNDHDAGPGEDAQIPT